MNAHTTDVIIPNEAINLFCKFLSKFSIETTPHLDKKIESYGAILPKSTTVMIASLQGVNFNETIRTAKRLRQEGMEPVPHIVARSVPSFSCLEFWLDELHSEAGVDHILVIAGDIPSPVGPYHGTDKLTILHQRISIKTYSITP